MSESVVARSGIACVRRVLVLVCVVLAGTAWGQARSRWWIEPANTDLRLGQSVELTFWLDVGDNIPSASSYRGIQASIHWNSQIVEATYAVGHLGFWPVGLCANSATVIRTYSFLAGSGLMSQVSRIESPPCAMTRSPFKVFTVPFKGRAVGTTTIDFDEFTRLVFTFTPLLSEDLNFDTTGATIRVYDPNPLPDADQDGVPDVNEVFPAPLAGETNMWLPDSDGDGLSDGQEDANKNGHHDPGETMARVRDTDGDRAIDGIEVLVLQTNPLNPAVPSNVVDADADELPDNVDPNPANRDSDGDRYTDGYEASHLGLAAASNSALVPTLGDVNRDTFVSNLDGFMALTVFLGVSNPSLFPGIGDADVNRDAMITNIDALIIQTYFLLVLPTLPPPG